MAFEKGKTKTGGRKKGTQNRLSNQIRNVLKSIYDDELENLPKYLEELTTKERIDFIIKITPYILPKLETVHYKEGEPINFSF